ncbi:hypothetical protein V6N11_066512 [Hibiscus sabdariffa]|uniref:RING-type E3 ubiquitin transferase n=1 Tax=Hibiscus sabdariffa TaxID=183260 RepID=A0ABR2ACG6_9ROSI
MSPSLSESQTSSTTSSSSSSSSNVSAELKCLVCLRDYQTKVKLQQIHACGHTFHMDCIDHWLANQTTCPLCHLSVISSPKAPDKLAIIQAANIHESSHPVNRNGLDVQPVSQSFGEMQGVQPLEQTIEDTRVSQHTIDGQECVDQEREFRNTRDETNEHEGSRGTYGCMQLLRGRGSMGKKMCVEASTSHAISKMLVILTSMVEGEFKMLLEDIGLVGRSETPPSHASNKMMGMGSDMSHQLSSPVITSPHPQNHHQLH